ncbi:helix-turn-helix domain-containing protein [Rubellimicrobium rubrum]|nr:helix-turn-helix domain-containing protein [Rubellimicrobium rubrum]
MRSTTSKAERRFYAEDRAIGRFGMRLFEPRLMPAPHWHGHVEGNFLIGGSMTYVVEDQEIEVGPGRLVLFWANIPHQLVRLSPEGDGPVRLANIYLPLDVFLFMAHIARLQVALMSGGMVALDPALLTEAQVGTWYRDYRSGNAERRDLLLMELNALLRRALLQPLDILRAPMGDPEGAEHPQRSRVAHVVAMLRFILENLAQPMTNADVAKVTGLHETYALSLFTQVVRMPMRRFIIRMRLLRARALLMESNATVASVAVQAGFPSLSQFYDHFGRAYGVTPQALRAGASAGSGT